MRIALAQINPIVGDLKGNREWILTHIDGARQAGADLLVFPELATTGYPPEDLLLRPGFLQAAASSLEQIVAATKGKDMAVLIGAPHLDGDLYNACFVVQREEVKAIWHKQFLPNYGVFDEARYFAPGTESFLLRLGETLIGLTVCEDIWQPGAPTSELARAGAQVIVNLSASPFHTGKVQDREAMLVTRARDNACHIAFCNLVGGQDELVFDGHSCVIDDSGQVLARAPGFKEHLLVVDIAPEESLGRRLRDARARAARVANPIKLPVIDMLTPDPHANRPTPALAPILGELDEMQAALVLGLHDYMTKSGFRDVVLGLSGGIDSALVCALATQALGSEHVHAVSMPSRYSSDDTQSDARLLAENLGIDFREVPIEGVINGFGEALAPSFAGLAADVSEENIQARARGTLLMALSNKFGWLVVSTGNKSEMAVGYATLYGDMVGGFALIKDVFKTDVFRLARHINENAGREVIPTSTIERPPTAELREAQADTDSLPPYDVLDPILAAYVEEDRSRVELEREFDPFLVDRVLHMVDRAEYKRRQSPPGVKLRPKAFGRDRRTPITNRWVD